MVQELVKQHSVVGHFLAELRSIDIQKDPMRFRRNLERIGEVMALELSRTLDYEEQEVITPLGVAHVHLLVEQPVLATILRAGLPMHQGLLNYFDRADSSFISAYRWQMSTWSRMDSASSLAAARSASPSLAGRGEYRV